MSLKINRKHGNGRMSQIVEHGGIIYLSGQVSDPSKNITEQTADVLSKIEDLLAQAGSDKEHILSATIWLKMMDDFVQMNDVWDTWVVKGQEPARACGEAALANPDLLVEIMIVAAKSVS